MTAWFNIQKYCQEFKIQELCLSEIIALCLRKKHSGHVQIFLVSLRLVFFEIFLISIEIEQGILLRYEG